MGATDGRLHEHHPPEFDRGINVISRNSGARLIDRIDRAHRLWLNVDWAPTVTVELGAWTDLVAALIAIHLVPRVKQPRYGRDNQIDDWPSSTIHHRTGTPGQCHWAIDLQDPAIVCAQTPVPTGKPVQ